MYRKRFEEDIKDLEREFNRFWNFPQRITESFSRMGSSFAIDVAEKDNEVYVRADVPGVKEDDIKVFAGDKEMTITGDKPCFADELQSTNDKPDSFVLWHNGRSCGKFESSFSLPCEIQPKSVRAEVKDGVLSVTAKKQNSGESFFAVPVRKG
uniref:SHSP domain-containing protein n=1 Tax=Vannella robusta TaxID=1487602 RepID=A0A7S4I545_9EUKA|mmetsp:Transcript_20395/g.25832  ORF Transcript_20395/g.25832 Transcript_20395/m.25832 type:complete len:153 (+) Transcript_20395:61-519(+)